MAVVHLLVQFLWICKWSSKTCVDNDFQVDLLWMSKRITKNPIEKTLFYGPNQHRFCFQLLKSFKIIISKFTNGVTSITFWSIFVNFSEKKKHKRKKWADWQTPLEKASTCRKDFLFSFFFSSPEGNIRNRTYVFHCFTKWTEKIHYSILNQFT